MSRRFAYVRISTTDRPLPPKKSRINAIEAAGFAVEPLRIITETISGSIAIAQRPEFTRLLAKMEQGDVLIVTTLDR
jgi:putative DNA-invertase from lambdoid prophage Rac